MMLERGDVDKQRGWRKGETCGASPTLSHLHVFPKVLLSLGPRSGSGYQCRRHLFLFVTRFVQHFGTVILCWRTSLNFLNSADTGADPEDCVCQAALASPAGVAANSEQEIPEEGCTNTIVLPALPFPDPGKTARKLLERFAQRSFWRGFLCNHFEDTESLVCLLAKSSLI